MPSFRVALLFALILYISGPAHAAKPACGDGKCNGGETAATCPGDCGGGGGAVCGDGTCDAGEDCGTCESDCGPCAATCGCNNDGVCNAGEDCRNCPGDCPSAGKGKHRICCGDNSVDEGTCGAGAGSPYPDSDGDGTLDCFDGCPMDPAKIDPGERGCGLEDPARATTVAGAPTVLAVTGGSLEIPADALPPGIEVTLYATPVDQSAFPAAAFPDEIPLTSVFSVEFSDVQWASAVMSLQVDLPAGAPAGFYGRTTTIGGLGFADNESWLLEVGVLDDTGTQLATPLRSAVGHTSFVVVTTTDALASPAMTSFDGSARFAARSLISDPIDVHSWELKEWTVLCSATTASCTQATADALADRFVAAVDRLATDASLGGPYTVARVRTCAKRDLVRVQAAGRIVGASTDLAALGDDEMLLLGVLTPNGQLGANISGIYRDGALAVVEDVLSEPPDASSGDTVVHELFHAVQAAAMSNVYATWILEGTATAVEIASILPGAAERMDFRRGQWRDWSHALSSTADTDEYRVVEFFLFYQDGDLGYLGGMMADLKSSFIVDSANSYLMMEAVLASGLVARYRDLIEQRNLEAYPYRTTLFCDPATCDGTDAIALPGMSAARYEVGFVDPSCPPGEAAVVNSMTRTLAFVVTSGTATAHRMLINAPTAQWVDAGTPVTVDRDGATLWLVNHDTAALGASEVALVETESLDYTCVPNPNAECAHLEAFPGGRWYKCGHTCCQDGTHCQILTDESWIHDGHSHYGQGTCYAPGREDVYFANSGLCTYDPAEDVEVQYGVGVKQACTELNVIGDLSDTTGHLVMNNTGTCTLGGACDIGDACVLNDDGRPTCVRQP